MEMPALLQEGASGTLGPEGDPGARGHVDDDVHGADVSGGAALGAGGGEHQIGRVGAGEVPAEHDRTEAFVLLEAAEGGDGPVKNARPPLFLAAPAARLKRRPTTQRPVRPDADGRAGGA